MTACTSFWPRASALALSLAVSLGLGACASSGAAPEHAVAANEDGSGCRSMVGRYVDAGRDESAGLRPGDAARTRSLAQILELEPSTGASVPDEERAVEVLQVAGERYSLALSKTTQPDTVVLWDAPALCSGDTLRLQTVSRYQSADGVHVTRQKLSVALYADADSSLILRRDLRERAIGLIDLRSGGGKDIETWRFHRLEQRPTR